MTDIILFLALGRYCSDIARHALEVLQIATLALECRRAFLDATEPAAASIGQTAGIAAVLEAAHGQTYLNDGEVCNTPRPFKSLGNQAIQESWKPGHSRVLETRPFKSLGNLMLSLQDLHLCALHVLADQLECVWLLGQLTQWKPWWMRR